MLRSLIEGPLTGSRVEAAGAGSGGSPHEIVEHADSVDNVVAQTGIQLREGVNASGRDAAQAAHRAGPHVAGALVEREREHRLMRQALFFRVFDWTEDFPRAVLI